MTVTQTQLEWDSVAREKFVNMINNIPLFHREIAKQVVEKKVVLIATARGSAVIQEDDIVESFFTEVPKAFYSLMVRLLEEAGFDYAKFVQKQAVGKES